VGRPTSYKPEYAVQLNEYFSSRIYIRTETGKEIAEDFKSLAGFGLKIGVHRDTLHEWSRKYPEFSDAYKRAKEWQEFYLITNGLKGIINCSFAIFTAKNVLNWRDKQDVKQSSQVEHITKVSDFDLEERIKLLNAANT
jgi:hypothetical protein